MRDFAFLGIQRIIGFVLSYVVGEILVCGVKVIRLAIVALPCCKRGSDSHGTTVASSSHPGLICIQICKVVQYRS